MHNLLPVDWLLTRMGNVLLRSLLPKDHLLRPLLCATVVFVRTPNSILAVTAVPGGSLSALGKQSIKRLSD